jgi:hypothetical protein
MTLNYRGALTATTVLGSTAGAAVRWLCQELLPSLSPSVFRRPENGRLLHTGIRKQGCDTWDTSAALTRGMTVALAPHGSNTVLFSETLRLTSVRTFRNRAEPGHKRRVLRPVEHAVSQPMRQTPEAEHVAHRERRDH